MATILFAAIFTAFGAASDARADDATDIAAAPVVFDHWVGTSFGAYLPPTGNDFIDESGGVDLVFHFHGAMLASRSWRASDLRAVIVSKAFSTFGTEPYDDAFSDHSRFQKMIDEVLASLARTHARANLHVRRITLIGFSAGFAAVAKILSVPRYFDIVDDVVLLDGLHAKYKLLPNEEKRASMGADHVWMEQLTTIMKFAREAVLGNKSLVITHSSIVTPDYASSTEASSALLRDLHVSRDADSTELYGMRLKSRGDSGAFHVLGFSGVQPDDHMNHLYAVGDVIRTFIVPRQKDRDAKDRRARTDDPRAGL